ncbi:MAG: PAS domain-containing sensor histidine kinase [Alphaproteobacteria bacterium]|jgi:two-component system nitrogen regulation sensor histidine kinase NtrY|nr:PAS domain-containing sensor histidine kinase [Alphaproteobacteria bacterium]
MASETHEAHEANGALIRRLGDWARRASLSRKLAMALAVAAMISGIATYGAITGSVSRFETDPLTILILLNVDLALLLTLGALVAWRLVHLWIARREGSVGSRLHTRLVGLFSVVAVAPAIIVAVFSVAFFSFGIQGWFNERVGTALDRSLAVAQAYLEDHRQFIRADVLSMASAINRIGPRLLEDSERFNQVLESLSAERSLGEAIVVRGDGKVLARTKLSFVLEFDPLPNASLVRAADGEVVIFTSETSDRVRALSRIDSIAGAFLYVGRFVDSTVLNHMDRLSRAVDDYRRLESRSSGIQITFTLLYAIVALLLLFAAVWIGLTFANRLVRPISGLVAAAERVRAGDLTARVGEGPDDDELATLARAFNRMTGQLESQRGELIEANQQLDTRRRFTEAVLFGVSAGVLGLDSDGRIFLPNRSALDLLGCVLDDLVGQPLEQAVPEMAALMEAIRTGGAQMAQDQVSIVRNDRARTLLVRVTVQRDGSEIVGFVVTFDDITELVNAQRAAAWTDVARRVAHEIKNPLTPIQLSAERLKRKYGADITTEPDVFLGCVDTIVRQVADIRRMVDEFSAFARMPAPIRIQEDIVSVTREALAMQQMAETGISIEAALPDHSVNIYCDARQVRQALTNLLLNAADAVHARIAAGGGGSVPGRIVVRIETDRPGWCTVVVEDNGRGLPKTMRDRLAEPYMTTRTKGTGLGLAIVKKIMEDHGGTLELADRASGGARVSLIFPSGITATAEVSQKTSNSVKMSAIHGA